MKLSNAFYVTHRDDWRKWLEQHHTAEKEVWLVFYKKPSENQNIPYDDAVEEALCFGWIDSIIQKIDEEKYARKFTPRKPNSPWSALNKRRAKQMIAEGRMTGVGLEKIGDALKDDLPTRPRPADTPYVIPPALAQALADNPKALENFNRFTERYKRIAVGWVSSAKREETLMKRIKEFVELTEKNEKIGMK